MHIDDLTLQEYLDSELDGTASAALESHLAECASCRARLAEWRTLFTAIEGLPALTTVPDLTARIVARVERQESSTWLRPLLVAQTATALLLLAWFWRAMGDAWGVMVPAWQARLGNLLGAVQDIALFPAQWPDLPALVSDWPDLALSAGQWTFLVGLALLAWLLGNGLLLKRFEAGD